MTPFLSAPMSLQPDWIDYNGHLNMAYYTVLFDHDVDEVWEGFGLGDAYRKARGMTTFAGAFQIRYLRELKLGDRVTSSFQILDHDDKRIHSFQELRHTDGWLAATGETIHLSIDTEGPKVAPFPPDILERIAAMAFDHARLPRPEAAGQGIAIRRKPPRRA